jgi:hypothetical protein
MATPTAELVIGTFQGDDALHIIGLGGAVIGGLDPNGAVLGASGAAAANAGSVGQIIRSTIPVGSAVTLTTATPANVTSMSVTAGDWDVFASVDFNPAATTSITQLIESISLTSATLATQPGGAGLGPDPNDTWSQVAAANNGLINMYSQTTLLISATTTVYLVAQATFTVAGMTAYGTLTARRRR